MTGSEELSHILTNLEDPNACLTQQEGNHLVLQALKVISHSMIERKIIPRESVKPGDWLLISIPEEMNPGVVAESCEFVFKPLRVQVVTIPPGIDVRIMGPEK